MLNLNNDKTVFIIVLAKQRVKKTENIRIEEGSRRNFGILLDSTLGVEKQANYVYTSCNYQI